ARGDVAARPNSVYFPGAANVRLWPDATMYYTIEADTPVQQNLLGAIDYWNTVSPFKILPRTSERNYVTFRRIVVDAACNSSVGMVGGQQFIGVTASCSVGPAIHEIGHAWGLLHEQERADRDAHVTILYDNIDKRFVSNFFQSTGSIDGGYYDYDSIMHYPATGFSRNFGDAMSTVPPGVPIGQRTGLSAGDVDAIQRLYGVIPSATTIASTPPGLPIVVDGETVLTPKRFEWTPGSQHTISAPSVNGTSPRHVFAKWSDGGAATHTITAGPAVTVFAAQFQRQYPVGVGVASGAGSATLAPATPDGFLADRQSFVVKAVADAGSSFVRWTGATFLGSSGSSVSATSARVQVFGAASSYQATFTSGPLHVVDSQPRGAQVIVDGTTYLTPVSFSWTPGSTHSMTVTTQQMSGNNTHRFTFREWDDGSSGVRIVTAAAEGATFKASFLEEFLLTSSTVGSGVVLTSPSSADGFYEAGTTVRVTAQQNAGQFFRYWVGDLAGGTASQDVVMDQQRHVVANFGTTAFPWLMFHAGSFTINHNPGTTGMVVAPGEIVSIFGTNIGPSTAQATRPDTAGRLPTVVGGVSVTFDGTAAAITYASPDQINAIVPYAVAGRTTTGVVVRSTRGSLSNTISVLETMPGLFTYDGSGKGSVAALNEDGSINSAANPAAPGSVVVLYGTGVGVLQKSFPDGQVMPAELVTPKAPVYVRFDKSAGTVFYAGAAPTLVNGALQVNVVVPRDVVGGGQVPVRLVAGGVSSAPGTTIWVK
ncbi:MAG TPA: M12 family metallopeptidase, partial [Gemmataceae bacterium]|nr:M12 family metallopeptidase [Gemmataceae bacterium]